MRSPFEQSISKCASLLTKLDYLLQAGTLSSLRPTDSFKKAARKAATYREVYELGASSQQFNLMMQDMSFFQFSEAEQGKEARLAYYPNPYHYLEYKSHKVTAQQLLDEGEINFDEFEQLISEADFTCDIPFIRYDLSLKQYCEVLHPAAHLHIGFHAENRWPARRLLTPYAFMLKVLMHYYSKLWVKGKGIDMEVHQMLDDAYRAEVSNCDLLDDCYFKPHETERLYIV